MHRLSLRAIVALCVLIGMALACGESTADSPAVPAVAPTSDASKPISPVAAADTASAARRTASAAGGDENPTPRATTTPAPTATAAGDSCLPWDSITADMNGEVICVRGLISDFSQSRQVGTRYSFSDEPNSFFMFSNLWEITNSSTGKTVGPGTCVEVTGVIELQGGIPFIHIDDLITGAGDAVGAFLIYDDPSACG